MKQCKKCNEIKGITEYYKLKRIDGVDSYRPYCKKCWYKYNLKYFYSWRKRLKNKEAK